MKFIGRLRNAVWEALRNRQMKSVTRKEQVSR